MSETATRPNPQTLLWCGSMLVVPIGLAIFGVLEARLRENRTVNQLLL